MKVGQSCPKPWRTDTNLIQKHPRGKSWHHANNDIGLPSYYYALPTNYHNGKQQKSTNLDITMPTGYTQPNIIQRFGTHCHSWYTHNNGRPQSSNCLNQLLYHWLVYVSTSRYPLVNLLGRSTTRTFSFTPKLGFQEVVCQVLNK